MTKNRIARACQFCRPDRDFSAWASCLEWSVGTKRAFCALFMYSFIFQILIGLIEYKISTEGDSDILAFAPSGPQWAITVRWPSLGCCFRGLPGQGE